MDMTFDDCLERIRARRPTVTVIGDYLLDGWWSGSVERMAREAPRPVVALAGRVESPGGAANTARGVAALGARARAVGVVGLDEAGDTLRAGLGRAGVEISGLAQLAGARTTTKVRIEVGDEMLLRLDTEQRERWPAISRSVLLSRLRKALAGSDALLICDYDSGLLDDGFVSEIARLPRPPIVIVDAHRPERWSAVHPDLVTPNASEAETTVGADLGSADARVRRAFEVADGLFASTGAAAVVVTLDRSGTVLLRPGDPPFRTRAHPVPEIQASGAGDVFAAALAVARAVGAPLELAVELAQHAADAAVQRPGTCVCSFDELAAEVASAHRPDRQLGLEVQLH